MPTVLLVDDEEDIRDLLAHLLRSHGYEVVSASNGREALDHLQRARSPCVVLLDLMMPVMDGLEFLDHVRVDEALNKLPVIITSAAPERAIDGVRRFLRKPFGPDAILRAIEEHCGPAEARTARH